jgi:DNA-3-methyladenine glycosylase I
MLGTFRDTKKRCGWCTVNPLMLEYHDTEWGVPLHDDRNLFEFLILDAFQAGLSWRLVLGKRETFRTAFDGFNPERIARYTGRDLKRLLAFPGIIKNQRKMEAAINNAQVFLKIQEEFETFDRYIWSFVDGTPIQNKWVHESVIPARSKQSDAMSKDIRSRGWRFAGSVTCYAFMQAAGLVNDHLESCFRYEEVAQLS